MLTVHNFESQIGSAILQRGKRYFEEGCVTSLEETGDDIWTAEVEGSTTYEVEVVLNKGNKVSDSSCDCPYDNDVCKHVVALLYALREEIKKPENKERGIKKSAVFEKLLQSVTAKEYQDFIRSYAAKNKNFQTDFELFFADKDNRIDVGKKYTELVRKLIRKYADDGYFDYRATSGLSKEINVLLKTGVEYAGKNNFRDAFALASAVLRPMMEATADCDDSNGNMGGSVSKTISLLEAIAVSPAAAIDIKEQLYEFLQTELDNKLYFDFGDLGYELFSVFQNLAVQLDHSQAFLEFIDKQLPKLTGRYDNYRKEYFQKRKIEFLQQTGKTTEAEKLVQQNMDIVEVRANEVNTAINRKDLAKAKMLIEEGIKIAEGKGHPGTVAQWQKELLRIALLEKDVATVRLLTKHFAFDRGFSTEYYKLWKKSFTAAEWNEEIEIYINKIILQVTNEWKKDNRSWKPTHPPLLYDLAPVYIEEKYWNRLLILVQQDGSLEATLKYHPYLAHNYPDELLAIYLPALEQLGQKASTRGEYKDLVSKMKKIMKDIPPGKEKILNLARRMKEQYSSKPRRPAMIDELNKIL